MTASLRDAKLSKKETSDIIEISTVLEKIFGLDGKTRGFYISNFFILEKYLVFEMAIRTTKEHFPNIGEIC